MTDHAPSGYETRPRGSRAALPVLTVAQARAIDAAAADQMGMPTLLLMENAARHAADLALELLDEGGRVLCVCGRGNNGGDGIAAARLLGAAGVECSIVLPLEPTAQSDAGLNLAFAKRLGIPVLSAPPERVANGTLIIDAVLGTGLRRAPEGAALELIEWINASGARVLSLDLPSGIDGDTGEPLGPVAVHAAATISFAGMKRGLLTPAGRTYGGRLFAADIGLPIGFVNAVTAAVEARRA
jgi:hydroxyethylthiazole kinase-like uncharacterized protein yjeF